MAGIQVQIKWQGANTAGGILNSFSDKGKSAIDQGTKTVALMFRDYLASYAQGGHPEHPNVITGRLSGSMRIAPEGWAKYKVGSDAEYAPYVEFGHMSRSWGSDKWHYVPAYPFFRPAVTSVFDSGEGQRVFEAAIKQALGK